MFKHTDGREQKEDPSKPEGIIALAAAIHVNQTLTSVNFMYNNIAASQEKEIYEKVCMNKLHIDAMGNVLHRESTNQPKEEQAHKEAKELVQKEKNKVELPQKEDKRALLCPPGMESDVFAQLPEGMQQEVCRAHRQEHKEVEELARKQAEELARKEEFAREEAEDQAKKEANEFTSNEAEQLARTETEEQAAKKNAAELARKGAEELARTETEEQAKKDAEELARKEAEELAKKGAEDAAKKEAGMIAILKAKEAELEQFKKVAEAEKEKVAKQEAEMAATQMHLGDLQQWQISSSAVVNVRVLSHEGSFGDVHLVQVRGENMAFKTIRTGGSEAAREEVRAALKEARALNEAKHANVIRLEGVCIDDPQRMGVLMEYAAQGTLRQVLESNPNMADAAQKLLIRGLLRGLAKLHSHTPKPILHGDLKATNVLVMADGTPKLADFGQASGASSALAARMSMSKTHRGGGTPVYSAPELFAHLFEEVSDSDSDDNDDKAGGGRASMYTMQCDLYSAGVLVWEIVTSENPWGADVRKWSQDNTASRVEKKLATKVFKKKKRPPMPDGSTPLISSIIEQLWDHDPAQRPLAQDVLNQLEVDMDAAVQHEAAVSMAANIMADDYAVPDTHAYTLHDFDTSNFKREYEWTAKNPLDPAHIDRLLGAVRRVIEGHCTRNNIDPARGENFFMELRKEWKLTDEVSIAAERLWTSPAELKTVADGRNSEFCFIFSQLLREDPASLARSCAIIARALNMNLVAGRTGGAVFPPNGECWRGGGFNEQHRGFFEVGRKYRVPGFLATATMKNATNTFMFRAQAMGYPVVQWCIQLDQRSDPQGENSVNHRCKHVDLLRVTHCLGEEEYLFTAFSVFTVHEVVWSTNPTTQDPHRITLKAAIDNSLEAGDLPLAPWS
jgi:serine/threonine protein kinase